MWRIEELEEYRKVEERVECEMTPGVSGEGDVGDGSSRALLGSVCYRFWF